MAAIQMRKGNDQQVATTDNSKNRYRRVGGKNRYHNGGKKAHGTAPATQKGGAAKLMFLR